MNRPTAGVKWDTEDKIEEFGDGLNKQYELLLFDNTQTGIFAKNVSNNIELQGKLKVKWKFEKNEKYKIERYQSTKKKTQLSCWLDSTIFKQKRWF